MPELGVKDNALNISEQGANPLDKLAQLVTGQKKLDKRARKKAFSNAITKPLMTWANKIDSPLKYHRTLACGAVLMQEGKKLTSAYCKQRWCSVCNGIRTAKLMKQYEKPITQMSNPMFLTLTAQAVYADELEPHFDLMKKTFVKVKRNLQKTYGIKLIGIRKTESQYKYVGNGDYTYNAHFHFIGDLLPCQALLVQTLWLNQWSLEQANPKGQHIRKADSDSIKELFKYETKAISVNKKGQFSPEALDVIYQSLYRKRAIQAYGLKANQLTEEEEQQAEKLEALDDRTEVWIFDKINYSNAAGQQLTNYEPNTQDKQLFELTKYDYASETINELTFHRRQPSETDNYNISGVISGKQENTRLLQEKQNFNFGLFTPKLE